MKFSHRLIIVFVLLLAAVSAAAAVIFSSSLESFRIPVAFAFSRGELLVAEKDDNTILRLSDFSPGIPMKLLERRKIEPDRDGTYQMVRHLHPHPDGVMVHSYVYDCGTTSLLGYRFNLYRNLSDDPETVFTIFLRNPDESPELHYAAGPGGEHYFVNNCRGQRCLWKLDPAARDVVMRDGIVPPTMARMGSENGELASWMDIYVDPVGTIYLSSGENDQVVVCAPDGQVVGMLGKQGRGPRALLAPADVFSYSPDPDSEELLTVASTGNRDWVCFDREGAPVRVIEPLESGYPYSDIMVGRIFAVAGEKLTFDLANKCLLFPEKGFGTSARFRAPARNRVLALSIIAVALILGVIFRRNLGRLYRKRRFPVFCKLVLIFTPLIAGGLLISSRAREIGYRAYLNEAILRAANLARAIHNSVDLADLEMIDSPEDRESLTYEKIYSAVDRLVDRKHVTQTPKWIIHKIVDGRYYFGVNSWRGPIFEPFIVPSDRAMFLDVLKNKKPAWGRFVDYQGEWVSYLLPVLDGEGDVVNVIELYRSTEEMSRIEEEAMRKVKENAAAIVVGFTLLALAFSWIFVRRLKRLTTETRAISRGDFDRRVQADARDEVGDLARAFNGMASDLKNYTEELARSTAEKERSQSELRLAHQIQQDILPHVFPPEVATREVALYGMMEPARDVGGDFYDYILLDDRHLGVTIADVSGKGVPASLFMMVTRTLLRSNAAFNLDPASTLEKVNRMLCLNNTSCTFVTLFYFVCDLDTGRVTYANAGHNPPIRRTAGRSAYLSPDPPGGIALGAFDAAEYGVGEFTLKPGDTLVLYTDGVTEAINSRQELFGEERLLQVVRDSGELPPRVLAESIFSGLKTFAGDEEQFDDITLLIFRYLPGESGPLPPS